MLEFEPPYVGGYKEHGFLRPPIESKWTGGGDRWFARNNELTQPFRVLRGRIELRGGFEELVLSGCGSRSGAVEQRRNLRLAHRLERGPDFDCLFENVHAVDSGDDHGSRQ